MTEELNGGCLDERAIASAKKILARLCENGYVKMSIPVQEDDEDMILSAIINFAAASLSTSKQAGAEPVVDKEQEPSREYAMVVLERNADGAPTVWCDPEIADLVSALNASGLRTAASCSGHGRLPGWVSLQDGREILVARNAAERDRMMAIFAININGERAGHEHAAPSAAIAAREQEDKP